MFKRLSISYKISFIAIIGFIGFAIYQAVNYQLSLEIRDRLAYLVHEDFPVLQFSNYVQVNFNELDKLYQAALAESDIDTLDEADQKADDIEAEFSEVESTYDVQGTSFHKLNALFKKYRQSISLHTRQVIEQRLTYDEVIEGYTQIGEIREEFQTLQNQFLSNRYTSFAQRLEQVKKDEEFIVQFGLVLGLILLLLLGIVSVAITRRLSSAFKEGVDFAHSIAAGNLDASIESSADDETGQLVQSLNSMRFVLKRQSQENHQREKEQMFLSGLDNAMRGDPRLQDLAEKVNNYLIESLDSVCASAFYLSIDEENLVVIDAQHSLTHDENGQTIDHSDAFQHALNMSDPGVQEALSTKNIALVPPEALEVNDHTQTLMALTSHWVFFPIVLEQEIKAMLALGFNEPCSNEIQNLLRKANSSLAISINSAQARRKVSNMLEQTQLQAKELQKQRYELALINDQLEDKTRDLDEQKNKILEKNTLLEVSQKALVEKSEALELSGKYKSQFLSTMSHELRTPLNSILLLSDALLENRDKNLSAKQVRHADVIHNAGEELLNLINDILDLSKVEEGKMDVVVEEVSPWQLLERIKSQAEPLASDKNLYFDINLSDDIPEYIYTDAQRLMQILKNFVSNAFKFTEQGGVTLTSELTDTDGLREDVRHSLPNQESQPFVVFSVKDTGIGIDKDKQGIIFEAFKQADGTTSRKFGGTGLGLTISRELSNLLGGTVTLESEGEGLGSVFSVYLPVGRIEQVNYTQESKIKPADHQLDQVLELDLIKACPFPQQMPEDHILLINHQEEWRHVVHLMVTDSPIKLVYMSTAKDLQDYLNRTRPRAIIIESESQKLVSVLAQYENLPPVYFIGGDDEAKSLKSLSQQVVVERWFDQHTMRTLLEKILDGKQEHYARVLFIEDNPVFQEVIKAVFNKVGVAVDLVSDAVSAMQAVYKHSYELLVIDLNLPDFSGEDIMRAMRCIPSLMDKELVLFTAEDLQTEQKHQLLQLANEVVSKSPQAINQLAERALELIEKRKHQPYVVNTSLYKTMPPEQDLFHDVEVLLVDDDERNLYSLGSALESEGMVVHQAQSGKQALEMLSEIDQVSMVLLDIMMPDMDGYEVLGHLRKDPKTCLLPVIALTAKAMVGDKQRCLDAGASDYLSKPVSLDVLLDKMSSYII